ncbi:hypothetical protein JL720_3769 [Aureococcus anophagefferens]|nr:hypothetical protein JL720_3769 [Aureococcus anophagefferens]
MVFFYKTDLIYEMLLHPQFFGGRMKSFIKDEIMKNVEGKCLGREGYVVAVLDEGYDADVDSWVSDDKEVEIKTKSPPWARSRTTTFGLISMGF